MNRMLTIAAVVSILIIGSDLYLRHRIESRKHLVGAIRTPFQQVGISPETVQEFRDWEKSGQTPKRNYGQSGQDIYSDGTLQILSSNLVAKFNVKFTDLWPYSLTTLSFDATDTDIEYFTADVSFKYTMYNITDLEGNDL